MGPDQTAPIYRSSLFWVHTVCFYTYIVSNVRQLFAADDFSRRHFYMHIFLGALRVNLCNVLSQVNSDSFECLNLIAVKQDSGMPCCRSFQAYIQL